MEIWALRLILIASLFGGYSWWLYEKGYGSAEEKHRVELAETKDKARDTERNWQTNVDALNEVHADEKRRIAADHARAIAGLRNRASSRLPSTPETCSGASPDALSAPDAAVAIGFAVEFDNLRAEYARCKSAYEALTK